jgi:hypothetical protein
MRDRGSGIGLRKACSRLVENLELLVLLQGIGDRSPTGL